MSCTKYTGMPAQHARSPHGRGGVPPRGDLDRVELRELRDEFLVVLEAVHRRAQVEPVGGIAERVQRDLVPAVEQAG